MPMSFLDLFSGPSPEKLEYKGDQFFEAGIWGQAIGMYERALEKFEKETGPVGPGFQRIREKIGLARESLAKEHHQNAQNYLEGGYTHEARDLLLLAIQISENPRFKKMVETQLRDMDNSRHLNLHDDITLDFFHDSDLPDNNVNHEENNLFMETSDDEEFYALCNTLPDDVCKLYKKYGPHFKTGYVALNQGHFQEAAMELQQAMQDNPGENTYIALELATAFLNLERTDEARELLENFLPYHPDALPAYQLLCEIYWEQKHFSKAHALLDSVPKNLVQSLAVALLKGETLYQSGNFEQAKSYYENFLSQYGWYEAVGRELAKTCEALGETDHARNIYKKIIRNCNACHTAIDPFIKDRYAELCFASGLYTSELLEMYLFLARENPAHAARYFDRISHIYSAQENAFEAARFRAFSERAKKDMLNHE